MWYILTLAYYCKHLSTYFVILKFDCNFNTRKGGEVIFKMKKYKYFPSKEKIFFCVMYTYNVKTTMQVLKTYLY